MLGSTERPQSVTKRDTGRAKSARMLNPELTCACPFCARWVLHPHCDVLWYLNVGRAVSHGGTVAANDAAQCREPVALVHYHRVALVIPPLGHHCLQPDLVGSACKESDYFSMSMSGGRQGQASAVHNMLHSLPSTC